VGAPVITFRDAHAVHVPLWLAHLSLVYISPVFSTVALVHCTVSLVHIAVALVLSTVALVLVLVAIVHACFTPLEAL